ncbi:MAG: hypothetical protein HYV07_33455 [Deltaproteobacteria bacterium]|nr:hypothetical protein [Deltaproteobacteria bacterium]
MTNSCVDGRGPELVDAAFLRIPTESERSALETHLVACVPCRDRYERLWRVARVLASGPESDAPSPSEIERMAAGLGLLDPPPPRAPFRWPFLAGGLALGAVASIAGALAPSYLETLGKRDVVIERGGGQRGASAAIYAVGRDGSVRRLESASLVRIGDRVKVHLSLPEVAEGPLVLSWDPLGRDPADRSASVDSELVIVPEAGARPVPGSVEVPARPGLWLLRVSLGRGAEPILELTVDVVEDGSGK